MTQRDSDVEFHELLIVAHLHFILYKNKNVLTFLCIIGFIGVIFTRQVLSHSYMSQPSLLFHFEQSLTQLSRPGTFCVFQAFLQLQAPE